MLLVHEEDYEANSRYARDEMEDFELLNNGEMEEEENTDWYDINKEENLGGVQQRNPRDQAREEESVKDNSEDFIERNKRRPRRRPGTRRSRPGSRTSQPIFFPPTNPFLGRQMIAESCPSGTFLNRRTCECF